MFERFTGRARAAIAAARDEARRLRHDHVGTEHLLLGLLGAADDPAAAALADAGVTADAARARVAELTARADGGTAGEIPFTPRAKAALELALREARRLDAESIDTGHVLLGVLREGAGRGVAVLTGLGADPAALRADLLERCGGPRAEPFLPGARPSTARRLDAIERRLESIETLLASVVARMDRT
ncbi:ATP-dependent Clp protease ATP-binding subunit ClpC1 [Actinomadura rubteroloni]|uniref:ATP-dependent Clp protease ATP-binding subunit ClpC1 n=1 Tax=Actinomadura rubteroloni TaxID=1926885 RepID=A0A2P4UKV2_9ACTN|nr:Clp protease N-terminal domain-containing protein [Actinomadura rubteroloni]POM25666.1 ATP-dependent Clp protease ATP-binding subunit ClpC1 [Actinomadura rubteroloni]